MIKTILLSLLALAFGLGTYLYFYLGSYKEVETRVAVEGPLHVVYKNHTGAYHEIGPTIATVEAWARENHLPCPRTFGEFLDDPQAVDQDRLRSHAGCILESAPPGPPATDMTYELRPARRYAIGHFTGSPAIGPFKVYPKVRKFIAAERLRSTEPVIEIYRIKGESVDTEYLFPLAE